MVPTHFTYQCIEIGSSIRLCSTTTMRSPTETLISGPRNAPLMRIAPRFTPSGAAEPRVTCVIGRTQQGGKCSLPHRHDKIDPELSMQRAICFGTVCMYMFHPSGRTIQLHMQAPAALMPAVSHHLHHRSTLSTRPSPPARPRPPSFRWQPPSYYTASSYTP